MMLHPMDRGDRWIREKAAASLDPPQVETTLAQLSEKWPANAVPLIDVVEQFPLGEAALLHLLAVSSICAARLRRNPETLLWLHQSDVCLASRGYAEMFNELHTPAGDSISEENFGALRFWKGREMTRVALRELANVAPLEETTGELSQIAEICVRRVFQSINAEFKRQHQPFIYPSSPTPDLLDEIANIKRRIERDVVGHDELERDVKLGRGGIREIEFVVQALQLIHGAHHAFLQEASTLKALRGLRQLDLLPRDEVLTLDKAYRFLRRVEHRLQIEAEQQTHTVPREPAALRRLALSLRFSSGERFTVALQEKMRTVRSIFERVISGTHAEPAKIDLEIFSNQKRAAKALADLAQGSASFHIAPRTRQIFRKLRPVLLEWLAKAADPDATLNQLVRFVEAYGLRSLLFELLVTNPRLLELLVKTFDASRFASELLIRRPQLLEDITRDPTFHEPRSMAENLRRIDSLGADASNLDPIRAYRQRQLLRIILREVLGLSSLAATFTELSDVAEACLLYMARLLGNEQLTIIALGKFGGRDISYGADLDVLFVGDDTRAAQNLVIAMAQPTAEGNIWALDARLRPEGEKGPLVCSLETYQSYYANRAQPWELQALTRARAVSGPLQNEFTEITKRAWRRASQDADLPIRIDSMLERIRRERGSGSDFLDFKTGIGGIIEGEFLVQALQMRESIWEPTWERIVDRLCERRRLTDSETANLKGAYSFLRRCESVLRRFDNKSISAFPSDPNEQRKLAIRVGHHDLDAFREEYVDAREAIHALYNLRVKDASA